MRGFGLVFTVTPQGRVGQTFWRSDNAFSACVDPQLRAASFPRSPKEDFYFGFEAAPTPQRT